MVRRQAVVPGEVATSRLEAVGVGSVRRCGFLALPEGLSLTVGRLVCALPVTWSQVGFAVGVRILEAVGVGRARADHGAFAAELLDDGEEGEREHVEKERLGRRVAGAVLQQLQAAAGSPGARPRDQRRARRAAAWLSTPCFSSTTARTRW